MKPQEAELEAGLGKDEFIYVLSESGTPWMAAKSSEHAFDLCRKKYGMVTFHGWYGGSVCRITQNGVDVGIIYCVEVAR